MSREVTTVAQGYVDAVDSERAGNIGRHVWWPGLTRALEHSFVQRSRFEELGVRVPDGVALVIVVGMTVVGQGVYIEHVISSEEIRPVGLVSPPALPYQPLTEVA